MTIDASSINTNEPNRDKHVRSADFLDVENFPNITFRSTGRARDGGRFFVDGELTIRGATRPVTLDVEVNGFTPDPTAVPGVGFSATHRDQSAGLRRQLQRPYTRRQTTRWC